MAIKEVLSAQDIREFHGVMDLVYAGDGDFIYPITADVEAVFDVNKNKSFQNGAARRWIALDGRPHRCILYCKTQIWKTWGHRVL
jgi:hypothetical protein